MDFFRKNTKFLVVLYLVFFAIPLCFAASKPAFLSGGGDAETKSNNLITSSINWGSALAIGCGSLSIIIGGIMLVPIFGQQQKAKYWFLGGSGGIIVGVAGLSLASWLYDKMA